jgi:hypothetical protein
VKTGVNALKDAFEIHPKGGPKPINAKCETVRDLPTFRDA